MNAALRISTWDDTLIDEGRLPSGISPCRFCGHDEVTLHGSGRSSVVGRAFGHFPVNIVHAALDAAQDLVVAML